MAVAAVNHFKVDLRAIQFTLYEHLKVAAALRARAFAHLSREECDAIIDQCVPLRDRGDRTAERTGRPGRLPARGRPRASRRPGFKEAWKQALRARPDVVRHAGRGAAASAGPHAIAVVLEELQSGANTAFNMYPGLTHGAADVIEQFALARGQRALPAGDVRRPLRRHDVPHRAARRLRRRRHQDPRATHLDGNVYAISGTKIFISAGDHDLTENIIHLVLARIDGAPAGTKGLSLFIVPKIWVNDDGSARRAERRRDGVDRAQDRHQGVGDRGAELRRERRLPRHPGRRPAARGHAADVPHDERRAHRRRRPGPRGRVDRVPERARLRARAQAGLVGAALEGSATRRACRSSSTPTCAACCSR